MYDISCDYNPTDLTQETRGVMSNIVAIWSLSYDYNPDYPGRRAAGRRVGWRASGCRSSQSRPPRRRGSRRPPTATHWLSPPAHNTPRIKGQCHEIFLKLFLIKKAQSGPNMNRQKRFPKKCVFAKIFSKIRVIMWVHAVVDYILPWQSWPPCPPLWGPWTSGTPHSSSWPAPSARPHEWWQPSRSVKH